MIENKTQTSTYISPKSPTLFQRLGLWAFSRFLHQWKEGGIQITLPDGRCLELPTQPLLGRPILLVHDWKFFELMFWQGDVGFGLAYSKGYWSSPHLTQLLSIFVQNMKTVNENSFGLAFLGKQKHWLEHRFNKNSRKGSKKNIASHYDLGNDFYSHWLDERMVYSSAFFAEPNETLEVAQLNKLNKIIQKADIHSHHHVLEIGSGWGALAIEIAKQKKCKVTTITLSSAQYQYTKNKIQQLELDHLIEVKLTDYRDVQGKFDRIVSVEMIEALGHEFLPIYFGKCHELLQSDGKMVIQVITMDNRYYSKYLKSADWIQKYIFPGAVCPSPEALQKAITQSSTLHISNQESIGLHYARTLEVWRQRFENAWEVIAPMGFDSYFKRMWRYYLCYCEAGFATRYIDTFQYTLEKNKD